MTAKEIAQRWRVERGYQGRGGVVVVFNNQVAGWVDTLRNPEHWEPGCVAVDEAGQSWTTIGGNADDGALLWLANEALPGNSENDGPTRGAV